MNDERLLRAPRQIHLFPENPRLHLARGMIVIIVESDLAPGDDFRKLSEPCQFLQVLRRDFLRLVGMNSNRGENPVMLFGKGQRGIELLWPRAGADGQERAHSSGARALKHGVAVFRELRKVNVSM